MAAIGASVPSLCVPRCWGLGMAVDTAGCAGTGPVPLWGGDGDGDLSSGSPPRGEFPWNNQLFYFHVGRNTPGCVAVGAMAQHGSTSAPVLARARQSVASQCASSKSRETAWCKVSGDPVCRRVSPDYSRHVALPG